MSNSRNIANEMGDMNYHPQYPNKVYMSAAKRRRHRLNNENAAMDLVLAQAQDHRVDVNGDGENYAGDDEGDHAPAIPKRIHVNDSTIYHIVDKLGKGGYGEVYSGRRAIFSDVQYSNIAVEVAVKFENKTRKGFFRGPPKEWQVYNDLGSCCGMPKVYYKGMLGDYYFMIMDKLGSSLWSVSKSNPERMVSCIGIEVISILEKLHSSGYLHRDIKPENLLFGSPESPDAEKIFLVDLGLATRWRDVHDGMHVKYDQRPDVFRGTLHYASINAHLGKTSSRRDDLQSLAYTLIFLLLGRLPWQYFHGENRHYQVGKCKTNMSLQTIDHSICPPPFGVFMNLVMNLEFDEEPDYATYVSLFVEVVGKNPSTWPIQTHGAALQLLHQGLNPQRSKHSLQEGLNKRIHAERPGSRWITVLAENIPMKQRFAFNLEYGDLRRHIQRAVDDGLFIRSVASNQNSWALVVDEGTGITSQVYQVAPYFLHKDWIERQWRNGKFISAVAGADNGCSLVVMSAGLPYANQTYTVSESFPFEWIKRKWAEGLFVNCMATSGNTWAIVMSSSTTMENQVVELDFVYNSEGIHQRTKHGYRITAVAATSDQIAFVLSKSKPMNIVHGSQYISRTNDFPAALIKEKRAINMYISSLCYGRTIS